MICHNFNYVNYIMLNFAITCHEMILKLYLIFYAYMHTDAEAWK